MGSEVMGVPSDSEFMEALGSVPEATEYDPDVWRVETPIGDSGALLVLSFDIGGSSIRLTRESANGSDIEIYREEVRRILVYSEGGGRGIIVESHMSSFTCELRVAIHPQFRLLDTTLRVGI
ncbi:hypothetical protein ACFYR2_11440 [Streptomyces microflavus]|uniref:hypothetical protein n=1 Tax=Streptomyces microflavus TaxID=1919 RepID=UPI0036BB02EA